MCKTVYQCPLCLSTDVQMKAWVNPNQNNEWAGFASDSLEEDDCWCNRCKVHVLLNVIETEEKSQED